MGKVTLTSAKKKAWKAFSRYIRFRAAKEGGMVECYTCGKKIDWKKSQAGHGIAGRSNGILFLESIVRPQCLGDNIFKQGALDVFVSKLIKEIGLDQYEYYLALKHKPIKMTIQDYLDIAENYERKYKDLL